MENEKVVSSQKMATERAELKEIELQDGSAVEADQATSAEAGEGEEGTEELPEELQVEVS